MSKNCMQCANCLKTLDFKRKREYHICALDRELHVNRRMYCEEWKQNLIEDVMKKNFINRKQA